MSELDWQSLSADWKSQDSGLTQDFMPLRRIVAVHRRRLVAAVAGEIAIAVAVLALSIWIAEDGVAVWEGVWMATLWGFLAVAAGFAWWNRRGTWRAAGDSVAEYVRLSRLRCERQRRTIVFAVVLFIAEAVAIVVQLVGFERMTMSAIASLGAAGIVIGAWCVRMKRRIDRELEMIDTFAP